MITEEKIRELNPEEDAYVVVAFMGQGSALMQMHPYNLSALQMILAGELLLEQGRATLGEKHLANVVRKVLNEGKEQHDKILVPSPKLP